MGVSSSRFALFEFEFFKFKFVFIFLCLDEQKNPNRDVVSKT